MTWPARGVLALGLATWPMAAFAQAPPVVTEQTLTVEGRPLADPGVLALIETKVGAPLSPADVRESVAHLVSLGRYDDVVVSKEESTGGLVVRYDLIPARVVHRIDFSGDVGLSSGTLDDRIKEHFGGPPPIARQGDLIEFLTTVYRDSGYLAPVLSVRPGLQGAGRDTLIIDVKAGERIRLAHIAVDGNSPDALAGLPGRLGLTTGATYSRPDVDKRLEHYVADLRGRGYYEAHAEHELHPAADGRTADLSISMDAGPHVAVVFEGDSLPQKAVRDLVPIEREGSLDEDLLEDSSNRIAEYLRAQGYRDAKAPYTRSPRGGQLAIVFTVSKGAQFKVDKVQLTGATAVPEAELQAGLRTRVGELFIESSVDADVSAIAEIYRRRGFTETKVTPVVLPVAGGGVPVPVDVRFEVVEGPRALIGSMGFAGNHAVSDANLRAGIVTRDGQPYYQPQLAIDRDGVLVQLLNRGYQEADVQVKVRFSADHSRADVTFAVTEGPQVFVEHVLVVGNVRTSTETIRREVTLKSGQPLSYTEIAETQRRLSALGLFRRVRITTVDYGVPAQRDLLVTVEEAPTTTVGYGGGLEGGRVLQQETPGGIAQEVFAIAPRGFVEFGRRNLFGKNQSLNLFARGSLWPRSSTTDVQLGEPVPTGYTFRDYRLVGTYRAPRAFGTVADFLLTGFLEQGLRSSYNFTRHGVRVEMARHLSRQLSVSGRYVLERDSVFDERYAPADKPLIDRLFPQVRLSTISGSVIRDTRDDPLGPTRGSLLGEDADLATHSIGSEVGFVKMYTQGFIYRQLPGKRAIVYAGGVRLGLARGFESLVPAVDGDGNPIYGPDGNQLVVVVTDLPASERFFAGGDTSVRGYALDRLGTAETIDRNGFPKGGNAVIVLNSELRVPVWHDIGVVGFVDAGNVFDRVSNFDFGKIRPTTGFGLRYKSPIGPIRVDLGFKLDRQTLPDRSLERLTEIHISLGQAF